jgi:hypothetical protein
MPVSESFGIKVVDARTFLPVELPRLRARLFFAMSPDYLDS